MDDESAKERDRNLRSALRRLLERYIELARRRKQAAKEKKPPGRQGSNLQSFS
jgi:predicted DNA-binding ribbon-helix-helix protein